MDIDYHAGNGMLCVIGDPVNHSLSPAIYNTLFKRYGIKAFYITSTVKKGEIEQFLAAKSFMGLMGFNCTMPHKKDVLPFLDYVEPSALALQSVNTVTICHKTGKLSGYSTDGKGLVLNLKNNCIDALGKNIIILGAGGAASSIALECTLQGAKIKIVARNIEKANALCNLIDKSSQGKSEAFEFASLKELCSSADIIINATNLGMEGCQQFKNHDFLEALSKNAVVCDIIYNPKETLLMKRAIELKLKTIGGIGMLIWQACAAFEIYCGIMPNAEDIASIIQAIENEGAKI